MQTKKKGSMKKQIIGTMLASAVILTAVGAAGFLNEKMEAAPGISGIVEVSVAPRTAQWSITDPIPGQVITDPNYTVKVDTINSDELRFFNCYGAEIADCSLPNGGNGVGYVSSVNISSWGTWTTQTFDADFQPGQEGLHLLCAVGYMAGVAQGNARCVEVSFFRQHEPSLTVQIPGSTVKDGETFLPEGDNFQLEVAYNDVSSIGLNINGKEFTPEQLASMCTPITNSLSGLVRCTIPKSSFPHNEDGSVKIVITGKDATGTVVASKTIEAVDPDEIDVPPTGLGGGLTMFANEDLFLGGVVALLAMGLATVYILFKRASKA
ncbi:hypothetical protein FWG76_01620 [Candidatus Saccharibacteria bacterium]|nr:hypothetical protein [Candidatus Saccharibacteria bacterium]